MYAFSDLKVIDMLQKIVSTYGRIGEHLSIIASPECLELFVANSSSTVIGTVKLRPPLFQGSGVKKNANVKARALDLILRRVEIESCTALKWQFTTTNTGQEQLVLSVTNINGVTKQFRLPCLHSTLRPPEVESVGADPFTFSCLPSLLREAFAACESSADELRMSFKPGGVYLQAQKKGKSKLDLTASLKHSGLKTIISLPPDAFDQITALVPRYLELKFKEFRTMLIFLDHVGEGHLITTEFRNCINSTPVTFKGRFSAFPAVDLVFKFVARSLLVPNQDPNVWLRVGQQVNKNYRARPYSSRNDTNNAQVSENGSEHPGRREDVPHAEKRVRTDASFDDDNTPPTNDSALQKSTDPSPVGSPQSVSSVQEVGYTQAPSDVRGLFD